MARKYVPTFDPRVARPQKISDAKKLIDDCFEFNGWTERDQQIYFAQIGVKGKDAADDVRRIIEDMGSSRLILFYEKEGAKK